MLIESYFSFRSSYDLVTRFGENLETLRSPRTRNVWATLWSQYNLKYFWNFLELSSILKRNIYLFYLQNLGVGEKGQKYR